MAGGAELAPRAPACAEPAATVEVLLRAGADPDLVDTGEGWSALMFAAGEGHVEVVRTLLAHGADPSLRDEDGDQAADHASNNEHATVVRMLQEAGAAARGAPPSE